MEVRAERSGKGFMKCLDYSRRARGFSKRAKELELPEVIKWLKGSCFGVLLASNSWTFGSDVMIATNITLLLGNSMQFLSFEGSDWFRFFWCLPRLWDSRLKQKSLVPSDGRRIRQLTRPPCPAE